MIRAVVDPGVLISAFISPSGLAPDRIVRAWRNGEFELLVSPKLIAELAEVLARPKFERQAAGGRAEAFVGAIAGGALLLNDPETRPRVSRDPDDDYLFALARAGRADLIVSGDSHLTELDQVEPPVLTPRELVDRLKRSSST